MVDSPQDASLWSSGPLAALEQSLRVRRGNRGDVARRAALYAALGWLAFPGPLPGRAAARRALGPAAARRLGPRAVAADRPPAVLAERLTGRRVAASTDHLVLARLLVVVIVVLALLHMVPLCLATVPIDELTRRLLGGLRRPGGGE